MAYMVTANAMTQSIEHGLVALDRDADGLHGDARRVHVEAVDAEELHDGEEQEDDDEPGGNGALVGEGQEPAGARADVQDERPDDGAEGHDEDLGHGRAEEDPADDALLRRVGGAVAGVVVAALGPAQSAQGDGEGQRLREALPVARWS